MLYRTMLYSCFVMLLAIGIVAVLALRTNDSIAKYNGFTRRYNLQSAKLMSMSEKDDRITAVSGMTNSQIYFQTKKPGELLILDYSLKESFFRELPIPFDK